ncbi:MAG: PD40 domain-containing protein, partial [Anaerolineae bacterium]|nr:PD40 domain-containing protein [Anaerolineae bacterium]
DYFIDNGGAPLPAGDWQLELYVEDKLQALGIFVIEDEDAAMSDFSMLVYTKCNGDHNDIYVADINTGAQQLIVNNGAGPSWSPGGDAVFFYGESGVDRQVRDGLEYVFDGVSNGLAAVSTNPVPTTINQLNIFQNLEWKQGSARWANVSPDGSMIAYDAAPGGDYRIYFLGTEANQQFRYELIGEQGDWSPDSQRVVYRSGRNGQTGIWISNRDDSGHTLLTNHGSDSFPAWSPDGQTIAFSREESGNVDIYTINVDGSNLQRLTATPGHDTLPTFTANGDIIFRTSRTGTWAIWQMGADGSNPTEIIANACVGNEWAYSRMDVWP